MAQIRIDLAETLLDGMDIKFKAPCSCNGITGLAVYYPKEDGATGFKELVFRDAHGNDLTGIGNLFDKDSYVKVIVDANNGYAYLQNAATNGYLNTAILGTYTHDAENLIGSGENGKFKATVSGTISTINVNGVACSVKCGEESSMDLIAGCWYTFILDGNTVNFNAGGAGGGGLNFAVVGGTAEPVSPKENTIWVNTDTAITSYVFAATEPTDPVEGMVWITTGTSSTAPFDALKKNGIMVYPLSAKQYVSGAWVDKTAKSYQNGAWVDWWNGELYDTGNEYETFTGGWTATALSGSTTVTKDATSMTIKTDYGDDALHCSNKMDLTDFSKLVVTGKSFRNNSSAERREGNTKICVWSAIGSSVSNNQVAYANYPAADYDGEFELDVSGLTGEYYVGVFAGRYYSVTVRKVKLS